MDKTTPDRLAAPLNALRAFEAAARHLSVKQAALELGVTPSAVSHQLRGLEDSLGLTLMRRVGPALELTEAGARLAPDLTAGFARITRAVAGLKEDRGSGPLRLSMLPTFAAHWLSPRLTRYPFERAGFDLLISTTQEAVDLSAGVADVAVRHGTGAWEGTRADLLFDETVGLFGMPALAGLPAADMRARIGGMTLFLSQYRKENFARWNATLPGGPIRPAAVMQVDSSGLALRAAMDGAGVALAGVEIAGFDAETGRWPSSSPTVSRPAAAIIWSIPRPWRGPPRPQPLPLDDRGGGAGQPGRFCMNRPAAFGLWAGCCQPERRLPVLSAAVRCDGAPRSAAGNSVFPGRATEFASACGKQASGGIWRVCG